MFAVALTLLKKKAHMLAVDDFGFVFGWGLNRNHMLGLPCTNETFFSTPTAITTLAGHRIVAVACGSDHSIFLSDKGWPFVAGSAMFGKMGVCVDDAACSMFMSDCPIRLDVLNPGKVVRADAVLRSEEPKVVIKKVCAATGHSLM